MANPNAFPSQDPADLDSLVGLFRTVLTKHMQRTECMLPARVIAFDRQKNLATVQPMIMVKSTDGYSIPRAQIASVPVFQIGAGNFLLNFPLKTGDLGFIAANDRDISLFMQSFEEAPPNTNRLHSFSDCVFFPSVLTQFTIDSEDSANVVLQTLDGSVRVALWEDRIKLTAPTVIIDAPESHFIGNITVDGNIASGEGGTGTVTISGNVIVTGEVTADGIPLSSHHHGGVTTGGGNTGGPSA